MKKESSTSVRKKVKIHGVAKKHPNKKESVKKYSGQGK